MERAILLIDMDAFFASVEQACNPALRGKPIAVVGAGERTVVTTSSYEARARGVKTGMNLYEAKRVCPELIVVVADNHKYTHTCRELEKLYWRFTPQVEVYSVDEAFLDVTGSAHLFGGPEALAKRIKEDIRRLFGLKATVGIGHNRLVAKVAVELSKPDGLRWIKKEEVPEVWKSIPVGQLWGIGPALARRLNTLGIKTAYELGRTPLTLLKAHFGLMGVHLKALGMGLDPGENLTQKGPRSIGHSTTLPRDITTEEEIKQVLLRLSEMVASRARRHNYEGRTVGLTVRFSSFTTIHKNRTLRIHTNDTHLIYRTCLEILKGLCLNEPIRLLGVRLSDLREAGSEPSLFPETDRRRRLLQAVDSINNRYGSFTLTWAGTLTDLSRPGVIAPSWRPSGLRKSL